MGKWVISVIICTLGIVASAALFSGCGASNTSNNVNTLFPGSCIGSGCGTNAFYGGDTENFNIASIYALNQYAGPSIPYQVTQATGLTVNINLSPIGTNPQVFLGQMTIQYNDQNGAIHEGTFVNGTSTQGYGKYPNTVSTLVGSTYRIFFEDIAGAIVLTIANPVGTDTVTTTTGQIWFYNFNTNAPNPLVTGTCDQNGECFAPGYAFCWEIDLGPYNCRNMAVPPSSSNNGVAAFSLLGSIPAINLNKALGL